MSTIMDLGKLRFYWAGDYNAATEYESNDIVRYGGNVFVYIYGLKTIGNLPKYNLLGEWSKASARWCLRRKYNLSSW